MLQNRSRLVKKAGGGRAVSQTLQFVPERPLHKKTVQSSEPPLKNCEIVFETNGAMYLIRRPNRYLTRFCMLTSQIKLANR